VVLLGLLAGGGRAVSAQAVMVSGHVVRGGPTGRPLAGAWVVLHRISRGEGRPIDSTRTDARGRFTLAIARPDSAAVYLASSSYAGIAYFSAAIPGSRHAPATLGPLLVYDTSSTGPAVQLARRLVTIAKRKRDGARDVLELVELENPSGQTRIAPDTLRPTWAGALPAGAIQFQVGQGDISPHAVTRRGDSVAVFGPIPPGETKQLSYAYVLAADRRAVNVPIDQATREVDLLLEDTTAAVTAAPLEILGVEDIGGRRFARYRMRTVPPAAHLTITLPLAQWQPQSFVPIVAAVAALVLAVAFALAVRRRPPPLAPPPPTR
jgi:hypothetical protein